MKTELPSRIFVFERVGPSGERRPRLLAFPEHEIKTIESQRGSENAYLLVNGVKVQGSFIDLIDALGTRVNFP